MRLTDRLEVSRLATDRPALADDGRREPAVAAPPAFVAVTEPMRLDPKRVELGPMPRPPKRRLVTGPIVSLLVHLLPLRALVDWSHPPAEIPQPIPVQLVIVQPQPPPPPPEPAAPKRPSQPPNRPYASDDFAETVAPKVEPGPSEPSLEHREAQPPAAETETQLVAVPLPPPPPISLPELSGDRLAAPVEARPEAVAQLVLPPKPDPPKEPPKTRPPRPRESAWPLPLQLDPTRAVHAALIQGADAVRDEYCAQALSLTLRNIGLLPRSVTLGREGVTVLSIHVLGDGTINGITLARSSGYPDIDVRIERMVLEVGRYAPLPPWMGPSMDFTFQMHFPNRWQH